MDYVESLEELRSLYAAPGDRAVRKQLAAIDTHARRFIELSPFLVMATAGSRGADASPRGGLPGFVKVIDETTVWLPDSPGNNRLDSLQNIITTPAIGLLFLIPGIDETLRVNGTAQLSRAPEKLAQFTGDRRPPKLIIEVAVREVFLHCAKALMRSELWSDAARRERSVLPTMAEMLADQVGTTGPLETQEAMVARYRRDL